jgi:transcriptional regulator with XRE-family HTH domain
MTGKRIGTVLQVNRERRRLTQQQPAKRAGVARSYLAKLKRDKNPSLAVVQRLATALGVPVSELRF